MPNANVGVLWTTISRRMLASDPALIRLIFALSGALSIGLSIGAEYVFVKSTGAMQIDVPSHVPAAALAHIGAANHAYLITAELLGVLVALTCALSAVDATPRKQLVSMAWVPVPLIAGLAEALALSSWRILSFVAIVATLGVAGYVRGYGPRWMTVGFGLFMGNFIGFTLGKAVSIGDIGWPIAEIGVGMIVAVLVKSIVFRADPDRAAKRMAHTFEIRAKEVLGFAETVLGNTGTKSDHANDRRLRRHVVRMNQAGLMLDATLERGRVSATQARLVHERVFDIEHALAEVGWWSHVTADSDVSAEIRSVMALAVLALRRGDFTAARLIAGEAEAIVAVSPGRHLAGSDHDSAGRTVAVVSFAAAVRACADAITAWRETDQQTVKTSNAAEVPFVAATPLIAGWLPGTTIASARASLDSGSRSGYTQLRMTTHLRAAVQMAVAGALAIVAGDAVSGPHFFWAVLTVFLLFFGPTNAAEQVSRSIVRFLATAAGIVAVLVVVHLFGDHDAAAVVIVIASTFLGLYLMRLNAGFMVFGLTVTVSQLYVQLHQYSGDLLRVRLAEAGIGAASVIVTVLLILPLHYNRVLKTALSSYLAALSELTSRIAELLSSTNPDKAAERPANRETLALVRKLDAAYQTLLDTLGPVVRPPFKRQTQRAKAIAACADRSRRDARQLAGDLRQLEDLDASSRQRVASASRHATETARETLAYLAIGQIPADTGTTTDIRSNTDSNAAAARGGYARTTGHPTNSSQDAVNSLNETLSTLSAALGMHARPLTAGTTEATAADAPTDDHLTALTVDRK